MSKKLVEAMADLDEDVVLEEVKALKAQATPALDIIASLQEGMEIVGDRFEKKEYFLSELIMSAEVFNEASEIIGGMGETGKSKNGVFVIGTIYDDIHDIGKNIVSTVMRSSGFEVIDLGVDIPTDKFIEAIKQYKPKVVGISCLLTTCFDNVKECIKAIGDAGLRESTKILVGGGPVNDAAGEYMGADIVGKNAQQTVKYCKKFVGVK
ncbi:cobalamin-binding protein [Clostridium carboxidivorans P7]|uniref:Cobalamin B12-binding domain protein n=1 Tax=Clostridium carboxidivorans P7 TaxID=536227 RepID=C6PZT9_9CLOT|nr:cobalamin-dependent protein [Clostridium carboxidivorans]AKN31751.1 cobalamin-binding protein [Clostridium carboxidivorans P7]EET85246.1 cobalamin B12-binding domain protein [Clostridium carboxidivorans P7]EFG87423.1 putative dimethylamine corrinoid protein [Clostridium carboxidivorans P7]